MTASYDRLTVRERIVREIVRKIEAAQFSTSGIRHTVMRREVPDDYDRASGAVIAVLEGREDYGTTASSRDNSLSLILQLAIPVGPEEEAATLLNIVSGELLELLNGSHRLGDDGGLMANLTPVGLTPEVDDDDGGDVAAGYMDWTVRYRTQPASPFAA